MPYIDFDWYNEFYQSGEVPEEKFYNLALKATKYIDKITFGRADEADEKVKYAVCATMDEMYKAESRCGIAAESNDGYSISYNNNNDTENLYKTAILFLPEELLYRGVEM